MTNNIGMKNASLSNLYENQGDFIDLLCDRDELIKTIESCNDLGELNKLLEHMGDDECIEEGYPDDVLCTNILLAKAAIEKQKLSIIIQSEESIDNSMIGL